jgi:hypothetical protein
MPGGFELRDLLRTIPEQLGIHIGIVLAQATGRAANGGRGMGHLP